MPFGRDIHAFGLDTGIPCSCTFLLPPSHPIHDISVSLYEGCMLTKMAHIENNAPADVMVCVVIEKTPAVCLFSVKVKIRRDTKLKLTKR